MSDMPDKQTPKTFEEIFHEIATKVNEREPIKDSVYFETMEQFRLAWSAAVETTRAEYDDKIKAMRVEIDKRDELLSIYYDGCDCTRLEGCFKCRQYKRVIGDKDE